jgi:CRP-like cAMP-binding protein
MGAHYSQIAARPGRSFRRRESGYARRVSGGEAAAMIGNRDRIALLRQVPLFADLAADELARLADLFTEELIVGNQRVFSHGDDALHFFVIREGSVAIFRDEVGKPVQLQTRLGPGDYFGEMGLFDGFKRAASARTSEICRLLKIGKAELLAFLDLHPGVAIKLQVAAARRHSENVITALNLGVRHEVRIRLDRPVTIELNFGLKHRAIIENLSLGGLCLRSAPASWQKGREVHFSLLYESESLPINARVTWRQDDVAGMAFEGTNLDHDLRVQRLLRRLLDGAAPAAAAPSG